MAEYKIQIQISQTLDDKVQSSSDRLLSSVCCFSQANFGMHSEKLWFTDKAGFCPNATVSKH